MRFQPRSFDESRIVNESRLIWFPIFSTVRREVANIVQISNLKLKDTLFIQLGSLTKFEYDIFGITDNSIVRPYEYQDNVHLSITYELDLNLYRIDREAYNIFDYLADMGGIFVALLALL